MPTRLLEPKHLRRIRFTAPAEGAVTLTAEASGDVDVYVVRENDLATFRRDKSVAKYKFLQDNHVSTTLTLPPESKWYLIIRNRAGEEPVAIHYEIDVDANVFSTNPP